MVGGKQIADKNVQTTKQWHPSESKQGVHVSVMQHGLVSRLSPPSISL